ncbi:ATP-dependent helicase/nuclease subunit A [Sphingomonas japonica]|uniref:DNA 3'-5' helicase n=1 Tax=Sphingomonas japonica TaxID=511662 RepID=A0ABX0U6H0_9SPHN|nr:ATP-dependent helicase/nuclease subunit A [Sphingomonas japonica]
MSVRPLEILKGDQRRASDPARHVWLSASAGTGKTHVLTARVFRLLLRGTDPGAILALTFTKAGAAEMAERINARLALWVRMSDMALHADLAALGERVTPALKTTARTLFARVLDAPGGGLRIQTIHSFCQTLLAGFPVEAGLVPGFRPIETREEHVLQRTALSELLEDEAAAGRAGLIEAIGALSRRLGEGAAEAFLVECARRPDAMAALPSGISPYLRRALDLPIGDIGTELERSCSDAEFENAALEAVMVANRSWGTATGQKAAAVAERWFAARPHERVAMLADIASLVRTAKGDPKKSSAKLIAVDPDYDLHAAVLGDRCGALLAMQARANYADCLAGALDAGRAYASVYVRAKRRTGAVDFDDLIRATVALLAQPGMGDWVRYKLDQATEHVLIDEAQDTNLAQWRIVRAIADEFFTGRGAADDAVRTLFSVGDYKQAIFGFQGTSPLYFQWAHRSFSELADIVPDDRFERVTPFETLSLTQSFRSTLPILEFVDAAVAGLPEPGMGEMSAAERHRSEVPGPGTVTLWPPVVAGGSDEDEEGWIDDATRALADRTAATIAQWLREGRMLGRLGRAVRPEDVMILVKRRGELASLLVARLYAEGVPVAGVDRLRLNAPLAVQDLLAAVRFALQPHDDLSLASLLVSPLIGWSQDALMAAAPRGRVSLWSHLRDTQPDAALAPLRLILARADIATPYRFFEELLSGELDGRRKLLLRLGEEARDPIEELLSAALNFESVATPSLQRFLDWFDRGEVEIKRDPSAAGAAVRVMTAHGAKGLQAPVVILADATVDPAQARRDIIQWSPDGEPGAGFPVFRPRSSERGSALDEAIAAADQRELEEHWRLFYVAATRAEEELVIAGALGPKANGVPPALSWYAAAAAAFDALGVLPSDEERRFEGTEPGSTGARSGGARDVPAPPTPAPDWLRRAAPVEARPPRPLAPSAIGDDAVADPPPSPQLRAAAERGRLLHALFERLPGVAPERRAAAAERWLAAAGGVAEPERREEIAAAALAVLGDPRFAALFGPEALAEAPIAAVVGGEVIAGTVDRLLVSDTQVTVIDFKTGRRAPGSLAAIPDYHLAQMGAYAAALEAIFPGREVRAALLYTAAPVLYELPAALLAAHKPGFAAGEQSLTSDA